MYYVGHRRYVMQLPGTCTAVMLYTRVMSTGNSNTGYRVHDLFHFSILSIHNNHATFTVGKHRSTKALKHVINQTKSVSKDTFGQDPTGSEKKRRQWSTPIKLLCVIPENSIQWQRVCTLSALVWDRLCSEQWLIILGGDLFAFFWVA